MAGANDLSPPLESRRDLIEAISQGEKPKSAWRVGTEHEKHVFYRRPIRPVPYEGPDGIQALLEGVAQRTGWEPFHDRGNPIGLRNDALAGGISLEPGGQFELSGAPLETLHETAAEMTEHMRVAKAAAEPLGISFLGAGTTPVWSVAEIPAMPKSRYAIMAPYMEKVGTLGTSMMFRSCTVQSNLDFSDEADMVRKLRVALALQPIVTALFASSPFIDGKESGFLSFRSHIWLNTDTARTGMLPFAFEEGMGYERYVDHALDVPMYFIVRDGEYIDCAGSSFRAFLNGALPQRSGEKPTVKDWEDHLSTLFPEVRLKQFLEMRGADMGNEKSVTALSAFWVGLLYDDLALESAWDVARYWTRDEREQLRFAVPRTALATPAPASTLLRFGTVGDVARAIVGIASAGLDRRARLDANGEDEGLHLAPIEETLKLNKTQAERWLDLYRSDWAGDLTQMFDAAAM